MIADAYDLTQLQTPVCEHCPALGLKKVTRVECDPLTALAVAISNEHFYSWFPNCKSTSVFLWHANVKKCVHIEGTSIFWGFQWVQVTYQILRCLPSAQHILWCEPS